MLVWVWKVGGVVARVGVVCVGASVGVESWWCGC
jgi:hypothetical protein